MPSYQSPGKELLEPSSEKIEEGRVELEAEVDTGAEDLEIKELQERIAKLEAEIEKERKPVVESKEKMVKQEIKDYLQELQEMPATAAPIATRDEADEVDKLPPSQQIGALISLAVEKGIRKAISVANDIDNPAILDEFHDTLVDRYYQELVDKKIIKTP